MSVLAASRPCQGCGEPLAPSRPNQRYHGNACRQRGHRDRRNLGLEARAEAARELIRQGEIDPYLGLYYVVHPGQLDARLAQVAA